MAEMRLVSSLAAHGLSQLIFLAGERHDGFTEPPENIACWCWICFGAGQRGKTEILSGSSGGGNEPSRQQGGGGAWFLFPAAFYLEGGCCAICFSLLRVFPFQTQYFSSLKHLQPGMEHAGSCIVPPRNLAWPGTAAGMSPSGVC